MQATFWRVLMGLGMFFHRLAPPRPPHPSFVRNIPSTVSSTPGTIALNFYVPKDYETQRKRHIDHEEGEGTNHRMGSFSALGHGIRRRSSQMRKWGGYAVVINFHGGGFTLGTATDDARWCGTVVEEINAVVVSVDYRLAPEFPFPTAVEDGVDAVLWIHKHAAELGIDPNKIAISGFSSGGNMAFSVPLRLYDHLTDYSRMETGSMMAGGPSAVWEHESDAGDSSTQLVQPTSSTIPLNNDSTKSAEPKSAVKTSVAAVKETTVPTLDVKIRCLVPWYPSLDYTRTREYRRATCKRADQELPALFTDLFDDSYLHPPKDVAMDSPYLSPGVAPAPLLRAALPQEIIMHTCEWDMLLEEGEEFLGRLRGPEVGGKNVVYTMVPGVPHGWDKAPNPWKPTPGVREYYLAACKEMRRVLSVEGPAPEHVVDAEAGVVSSAETTSRQIVR